MMKKNAVDDANDSTPIPNHASKENWKGIKRNHLVAIASARFMNGIERYMI